ncbi:hypothetical protein GCM10009557_46820 [Virgisporangium ochraceum]|uniref:Polyketide cyclase/dehydrase n=1 Tax=Virgisporangium ochraceum TaxID=65505 RepID=A0A8J4EGZ1_9ACTN|nr:SRPBCC family protein [Virgisporangium ochraceum]GIJ71652.1 hypothetical protein Voc01_065690 [Virgisporangium ochraceum]
MTRIRGEITIDAPVEDVFDLVADERNEPRYNPRISRAVKVNAGPVGPGARFMAEPRGGGYRRAMAMTILEYDRPRRLHNAVRASYLRVDGVLTFQEVPGGTRLSWNWDTALVGPMKILSPLLAVVGPAWERRNWVGLRTFMESRASGERRRG